MSKKKFKGDGIYFTGNASDDVTGSQYLIKFNDYQCLLECGLHQSSSNNYLDSYRINSEKFAFKTSEIDFVFLNHVHIDHIGLLPRLVREGFNGKIIATSNTAKVARYLLYNSCHIIADEARILSKRYKRNYQPLYEPEDVDRTLDLIYEYDEYYKKYKLNDSISFQWIPNSHCIGAAQLELELSDDIKTKRILYTSDLGALNTKNHYLVNTEIPKGKYDVVIMESTYGSQKKPNKKNRNSDVEHLEVAINTVLERKGSVVLPCFSFSRTQELLTTLYDIYGNDKTFRTPIIVDSKLSCDICKLYGDLLSEESLNYWNKVYNWANVTYISEKEDSLVSMLSKKPRIIISSSGFCTNGRVVNYLKKYLRDRNSMIIFTGYVGDNPSYLSYKIKNFSNHKTIMINKEQIPNRADCISLSTFSSHANYDDLVKFGSSLNTTKLILVHGSAESKKCLADGLKRAISKNDKTYRVLSAHKGMVVHL